MVSKTILVLACLALMAHFGASDPIEYLETQSIRVGFQGLIGEIAGDNSGVAACTPCQPIGVCAGRCCYSPPYHCCIISGNQCYCGCS